MWRSAANPVVERRVAGAPWVNYCVNFGGIFGKKNTGRGRRAAGILGNFSPKKTAHGRGAAGRVSPCGCVSLPKVLPVKAHNFW